MLGQNRLQEKKKNGFVEVFSDDIYSVKTYIRNLSLKHLSRFVRSLWSLERSSALQCKMKINAAVNVLNFTVDIQLIISILIHLHTLDLLRLIMENT